MKNFFKRALPIAVATGAMFAGSIGMSFASTITVSSGADPGFPFGPQAVCSLREAIQAANTNTAVGACTAGQADDIATDEIVIQSNVPEITIEISTEDGGNDNTGGDFDILSNMIIDGSAVSGGVNISTNGFALTNIFDIPSTSAATDVTFKNINLNANVDVDYGINSTKAGVSLTLDSVNVQSASIDGLKYNNGSELFITNSSFESSVSGSGVNASFDVAGSIFSMDGESIISGNGAHGVQLNTNGSSMDIVFSDITANLNAGSGLRILTSGGSNDIEISNVVADNNNEGIYIRPMSDGSNVNITNVSTYSNTASGLGISDSGVGSVNVNLTVKNSTFNGGSTSSVGYGISLNFSDALALTFNIINSTFTQNLSGLNVFVLSSSPTFIGNISNSTFTHNGGAAIADNGVAPAASRTLNLKSTIVSGNCNTTFTTLNSSGYNLIEDSSACVFDGTNQSTDILNQNPSLDMLADNGGNTQTYRLLPGSLALNAGSCTDVEGSPVLWDQRGADRPTTNCDIGAYEEMAYTVSNVPTSIRKGNTSTFTVVLDSSPDFEASVVVNVSSSDPTKLEITEGATLTFDHLDWNSPHTVKVKGLAKVQDITLTIDVDDNSTDGPYSIIDSKTFVIDVTSGGGGGGGSTPTCTTTVLPFTDLPADNKFYNEIRNLYCDQVISGAEGGTKYYPDKPVTRGEMTKFVRNAFNLQIPAGDTLMVSPYKDSITGSFEDHILVLTQLGVVNGFGDGEFKQGEFVTRYQLSKFIFNAMKVKGVAGVEEKPNAFPDVDPNNQFAGMIAYIKSVGIIQGYPDGKYKGDVIVNRDVMAKFIDNARKI